MKKIFIPLFFSCLLIGCVAVPQARSTGEYLDDATLTSKVKIALIQSSEVSASRVTVNTYRGDVQLSGFVKSEAEMKAAVRSAQAVSGIHSIINNLRLREQSS